jgi:hypothetical protein
MGARPTGLAYERVGRRFFEEEITAPALSDEEAQEAPKPPRGLPASHGVLAAEIASARVG